MITDIDSAASYVHVEFYILVLDSTTAPFFQALARATERGVAVRVLSDHLAGLIFPGRKETLKYLQDIGAEYHPMLPLRPFLGSGRGLTCATTARSSSSTATSDSPDRRTHRRQLPQERQPETRTQVARADDAY